MEKKLDSNYTRILRGNTPQSSIYTATYHPELDELDMRDTVGEVGTSS